MKQSLWMATLILAFGCGTTFMNAQEKNNDAVPAALDFTVKSIDGNDVSLADYQGKVLVVVNVASRCGMTPQYAGLQSLYEANADRGLAVLGFPCNQFGGQEPGTEEEIKTFCSDKYNVTFDMFSKVDVNGENAAGLYAFLTRLKTAPAEAGDITWNFEKFVIDRSGNVIGRFGPRTRPDDEQFVAVIEKALQENR